MSDEFMMILAALSVILAWTINWLLKNIRDERDNYKQKFNSQKEMYDRLCIENTALKEQIKQLKNTSKAAESEVINVR